MTSFQIDIETSVIGTVSNEDDPILKKTRKKHRGLIQSHLFPRIVLQVDITVKNLLNSSHGITVDYKSRRNVPRLQTTVSLL